MGIRINKVLGYGFHDMIESDPRIDWKQFEIARESSLSDFNTYLQLAADTNNTDLIVYLRHSKPNTDRPSELVHYDTEFGDSEILLFSHPGIDKWRRSDDSIDYYESKFKSNTDMIPKYQHIPAGIYPYDMGDSTYLPTGDRIPAIYCQSFGEFLFKLPNGNVLDLNNKDELAKCVPEPPNVIYHLARFFGVRDEYLNLMTSGLYEYWS